jgi:hypothetical protein
MTYIPVNAERMHRQLIKDFESSIADLESFITNSKKRSLDDQQKKLFC